MAYNSDPNVVTLATSRAADPNIVASTFSRLLMEGAKQFDDFSRFEGEDGSDKPIYEKTDLSKGGSDSVIFTVMSALSGPGVRGETELQGNESEAEFKTFGIRIDFWRDAFALTEKKVQFMSTGKGLKVNANRALQEKLGLKKQRDAMISLIKKANGNVFRPNNRRSRDAIRAGDILSPDSAVIAKAFAQRIGAKPTGLTRDKNGSPNLRYMVFATDTALNDVRAHDAYQLAQTHAAVRGGENPLFTGNLTDWQNLAWFEHIIVDPDYDDVKGSPMLPQLISAVEFHTGSAGADCIIKGSSSNTKNLYSQDWPGYRYRWFDGASDGSDGSAVPADSNEYYAWGITPDGKIGFCSYIGSTGNNGNQITVHKILSGKDVNDASHGTSTKGYNTVGQLTTGTTSTTTSNVITLGTGTNLPTTYEYTDKFPAGTRFLSANAKGTVIGYSFLMGRGALCRAYGSIREQQIEQESDYGFVSGFGYKSIFGQAPYKRTDGITSNYILIEHAVEMPGFEVPALED